MSCHHSIRCLECKENEEELYINWGEKPLIALLSSLPKIFSVYDELNTDYISFDVYCHYTKVNLDWFRTHQHHKLVIVDEYGYLKPCACGKEHSGNCGLTLKYEV